jgi:hypothetical protein
MRVRRLLDRMKASFNSEQRQLFAELIDHDEQGVALEIAVGILLEGGQIVPLGDYREIQALGREMRVRPRVAEEIARLGSQLPK